MGFSTAITGLKASTTELNVTGNNIANASTVGFKTGRTEFADIFSTVVVGQGSANSAGSGVIVADIAQDFKSGTIQFTNNNLDLAIDGSGFFQLNDGQGGISYTRAGGFELDKDGNVVSKNGSFLQGFGLDAGGNMLPSGNLAVSEKESKPQATSTMGLSVNIDDRKNADDLLPVYSPDKPASYSYSTTSRVFDSLGNENTIKFDYVEQRSVRERQTIELSPASFPLSSITLAGQTITPAGGPFTTANDFFAAMTATPTDTAATLTSLTTGDDRIKSFTVDETDPLNHKLQITYAASAANVDEIDVSLPAGGIATVKSEDVSASEVQQLTFADAAADGIIVLGTAPNTFSQPYIATDKAADIVKKFADAQSDIKAVFPDIESVLPNKDDPTKLDITYKADAGDVDPLAFIPDAALVGLTEFETGDKDFKGIYQLYAYLNGTEPLDIGKLKPPGSNGAGVNIEDGDSEPGPIILKFSSTGLLETVNGKQGSALAAEDLIIRGADAAADPSVDGSDEITLNITGTSQFASESILNSSTQDGFTKGDLIGINFASDGTMVASFSNGQDTHLGRVALATFENQSGLQPIGDTAWAATLDSGQPILNPPGVGLNGQLRSASLEQSNVDLSEQLVKLIEAQRNFQANSKTLQTENSITQTILQIS